MQLENQVPSFISVTKEEPMMVDSFIQLPVNDRKRTKQLMIECQNLKQCYHVLFQNNTESIFTIDAEDRFTSVNSALEENSGYTAKELIGLPFTRLFDHRQLPIIKAFFDRARMGETQQFQTDIIGKLGKKDFYDIKLIPVIRDEKVSCIYGIAKNVTELKKIENKLTELSYYDHLTGLPNKHRFTEQLISSMKRAKKNQQSFALLSIDIDRFKMINESVGYLIGDQIIQQLAYRVNQTLPTDSFLGSFGGDRFLCLLPENLQTEEIMRLTQTLLETIDRPIIIQQQEIHVTASFGISLYPNDGIDSEQLMKNADIAMHLSKQKGGNQLTFFSEEMNEEVLKRFEMEGYLRKALKNKQFTLHYQPLVCLESGELFGSEALIRWYHPKIGNISPAQFIPLAEETGLINDIGRWVLNEACKQNKLWHDQGFTHLQISVNVAARQFQQKHFLKVVKDALQQSGLPPKYLILELTESTMLKNKKHSIAVMKELQRMGIQVSIDDFGTGYSSLSYLKDLPIDTLKIDRSFIHNLRMNTSDAAIVKAIITMGKGLQLKVLAEGVETEEQMKVLKKLDCHFAQGYFFQKPLVNQEFEKGLQQQ
ncbi:hypothetical protein CKF48_02315 [Cytobacillus kochii]|uniref:Diguanylate cyclase n=3 Tax=Cytobacillus TaxID=2675230 RepID=A0A248TDS7_9BACI|nr:hypothetical protein CKF48_02315 [Cytobacillus kochii]